MWWHIWEREWITQQKKINDTPVNLINEVWVLEEKTIHHLVKKNCVERHRSEKDRRVVFIRLTEKGVAACEHHADYHRQMTSAVMEKLTGEEVPVLVKTLDALSDFFKGYGKGSKQL